MKATRFIIPEVGCARSERKMLCGPFTPRASVRCRVGATHSQRGALTPRLGLYADRKKICAPPAASGDDPYKVSHLAGRSKRLHGARTLELLVRIAVATYIQGPKQGSETRLYQVTYTGSVSKLLGAGSWRAKEG